MDGPKKGVRNFASLLLGIEKYRKYFFKKNTLIDSLNHSPSFLLFGTAVLNSQDIG
jgi:hypothetical protein